MTGSTLIDALDSEKWKELLGRQLSADPKEQLAANLELHAAIKESHARTNQDLWINHRDIAPLIQIAMTVEIPRPPGAWNSAEEQILDWFWDVQHPLIAPAIADFYSNAPLRAKMSALVVLTMQRTSEALTVLTQLIGRDGFPEHMHARFFWELNKCAVRSISRPARSDAGELARDLACSHATDRSTAAVDRSSCAREAR